MKRLSGDQNGDTAPSVPASSLRRQRPQRADPELLLAIGRGDERKVSAVRRNSYTRRVFGRLDEAFLRAA